LHTQIPSVNASGIPTYLWNGWYDADASGAAVLFANLSVPKKMAIGAWGHGPNEDNRRGDQPLESESRELLTVESRRWFDYWLKGIDNGVMDEAPVHYAVMTGQQGRSWRTAERWPPAEASSLALHLTAGPSGSIASIHDGVLVAGQPPSGKVAFRVDYGVTTGQRTRYYDGAGRGPMAYPDMAAHGRRSVTFTTAPLDQDLAVVGHPVVTLFARSTAADGELDVYLEEVDASGRVTYLSDGALRASHRTLGAPPYRDYLGLPYPSSLRADVEAAPRFDEAVAQLRFDLQPTANLFERGHRIRIAVTAADADDHVTIPILPEPEVTLFFGGDQPSQIELPVLPAAAEDVPGNDR
jgi:putative CocE/NonD family hydrolase